MDKTSEGLILKIVVFKKKTNPWENIVCYTANMTSFEQKILLIDSRELTGFQYYRLLPILSI